MFGFGILTYVKIAAVVVILSVCGYYVWSYHHMQTKIAALQTEIDNLKARAEVIEKAQVATDKFMKARQGVVRKNVQKQAEIDQVVESKDDAGMQQLYLNRGLLQHTNGNTPQGGGKGATGNLPGR